MTYLLALALALLAPPLLLLLYLLHRSSSRPSRHRSALVLVLGDIGRSPRMMYHADSLSSRQYLTYLIGYSDTPPIPALLESPHIHILPLLNPPAILLRLLPWVLRAPLRILYQVISTLYLALVVVPLRTEIVLVQTPPAIPTLALAQVIAWLSRAKLVLDWHNTGSSILALRLGKGSKLVSVAEWVERRTGRRAWAHLFVTRRMEETLVREWRLEGKTAVLHDRPPSNFRRTEPLNQHELFQRLTPTFRPPLPPTFHPPSSPSSSSASTIFTHPTPPSDGGIPLLSPTRPALLVSSTSWTPDEDFSLLLTALDHYASLLPPLLSPSSSSPSSFPSSSPSPLPALVVLITGRGPLLPSFLTQVAEREAGPWRTKAICVRTLFLPARDYPTLLGCADLGVSLHSSSSGLDLPMKVVDMFGCGVPVLARGFEALGELVQEGRNGRVFVTGKELGEQLVDLLSDFPNSPKLNDFRAFFLPRTPDSPGGHSPPAVTVTAGGKPRRRRPSLMSSEGKDDPGEWSSWDENWERVVNRGLLVPHRP